MQARTRSFGWAPWAVLLCAVPVAFGVGTMLRSADPAGKEADVPRAIPRFLLQAECVKEMGVPDDGSADPFLVAGCDDADRTAYIRRVVASTVTVSVDGFHPGGDRLSYAGGTAVVIGADGTMLTAYHVVDDAVSVSVSIREVSPDGRSVAKVRDVPVDVVAFSKQKDVALLRPNRKVPMPPPLPVRHLKPAKGDVVWHFGLTSTWAYGEVEDADSASLGISPMIRARIRGNQGDSGGPLVAPDGAVLGIMLSVTDDKKTSYFLPVADALEAVRYDADAGTCGK